MANSPIVESLMNISEVMSSAGKFAGVMFAAKSLEIAANEGNEEALRFLEIITNFERFVNQASKR